MSYKNPDSFIPMDATVEAVLKTAVPGQPNPVFALIFTADGKQHMIFKGKLESMNTDVLASPAADTVRILNYTDRSVSFHYRDAQGNPKWFP